MKKLCDNFWKGINPAYACMNELVVLPEDGDCGFSEYFDYKAGEIIKRKKIFSSMEQQNKLALVFPEPDCKEYNVFERFFESPTVIAENNNFEGLFAVDISNYVNNLNHERFLSLISYIKANPQTVYALIFYTNDEKEIQRVYSALLHHMDIVKTVLPLPTREQLVDYTFEELNRLNGNTDSAIREALSAFYARNRVGYDAADFLIRYFKLNGFDGTVEAFNQAFANLDLRSSTASTYPLFGY